MVVPVWLGTAVVHHCWYWSWGTGKMAAMFLLSWSLAVNEKMTMPGHWPVSAWSFFQTFDTVGLQEESRASKTHATCA